MAEQSGKRPFVIGLTGSIGMGKTETAKLFAKLGIPVYDADAAVHALYEEGGEAVAPIAAAFPGTAKAGRIDRGALSGRLAGDDAAFRRLESIVHPLVLKKRGEFLAKAAASAAEFTVLDIPLLFETGSDKDVDAVVVVSAPVEIQRERVLNRPGMTIEKLQAIESRQVPDAEKRAKADFVIETGKGIDHAFAQVKDVVAALRKRRLGENSQRRS